MLAQKLSCSLRQGQLKLLYKQSSSQPKCNMAQLSGKTEGVEGRKAERVETSRFLSSSIAYR